jgi:hypothetical protein
MKLIENLKFFKIVWNWFQTKVYLDIICYDEKIWLKWFMEIVSN